MDNIIVLIDMDDVMCEFVEALCKCLNNKYHTNVSPYEITGWGLPEYFPSLTVDEIFNPTHTAEFWSTVRPMNGAPEKIKLLMDEGFKIYVCTSSDYRTIKPKFDLVLKKYFPYISWKQVIITKDKGMVRGDILVDDGIHNLEGTDFEKILMSRPHNEWYDEKSNGVTRAHSWDDVYVAIHEYAQKKTLKEMEVRE